MLPIRRVAVAMILMLSAFAGLEATRAVPGPVVTPAPPTITRLNPPWGSRGSGVTIEGGNLGSATDVTFNGVSVTLGIAVPNTWSIRVIVPPGALTGPVRVVTPDGEAVGQYDFQVLPHIVRFTPNAGGIGTSVQITGDALTGATEVLFGGTPALFVVDSDTQITATVPANARSGPIRVTTAGGPDDSSGTFTFYPPPTITSIQPTEGQVFDRITIRGTNLDQIGEVTMNGLRFPIVVLEHLGSRIEFTVPLGAMTGSIGVNGRGGSAQSADEFRVRPRVGNIPFEGQVGQSILITGYSFTGATEVLFGGVPATFTVQSDEGIRATVPEGARSGRITVVTPSGSDRSFHRFSVLPPTAIMRLSPTEGPVGTVLTIFGQQLDRIGVVYFTSGPGSVAALAPTVLSPSIIRIAVPVGATTGRIHILAPDGRVDSPTAFIVLPRIDGFTPAVGIPGSTVQISGMSFTGVTNITFANVDASFTVDSDTQITAIVPPGARTGRIRVITEDGRAASLFNFIVVRPLTITSFTPPQGTVGTTVTIRGTHLNNVTDVSFNGVSAGPPVILGPGRIQANVPPGATTGPIRVTTPVDFELTSTDFQVLPRIDSFAPASGAPGTSVQISGSSFTGATQVRFAGIAARFTVDADTQITAVVPPTAVSGRITVVTAGGLATSPLNFVVNQVQPPTIAPFTPVQGPVGTIVEIIGTDLGSVTDVTFNGVSAGAPEVLAPDTIRVRVPANATRGPIGVTNSAGTAASADVFTVTPRMDSFSPTHGRAGDLVTITGTTLVDGAGSPVVRFGAITAEVVSYAATSVVARVPVGAVTSNISLTTLDGTTTNATDFVIDAAAAAAVLNIKEDAGRYAPFKDLFSGGYLPAQASYMLENTGTATMSWSAEVSDPWLTVSPVSGTLDPGATVVVSVAIEAALANTLTAAEYTGRVYFSNRSGGTGSTTRPVYLALNGIWPLRVRPAFSFLATGSLTSPPAPATLTYTLSNLNTITPIDWTGTSGDFWVQLSSSGGTVPGLQSVDVTATLSPGPSGFSIGTSAATLTFTQIGCCVGTNVLNTRFVKVIITEDDPPNLTVDVPIAGVMSTTLSGTVADNGTIAALVWSNARTGQTESIEVNQGVWTTTIPLLAGVNDVTVTAFDDLGNFSSRTLSIDGTLSPVAAIASVNGVRSLRTTSSRCASPECAAVMPLDRPADSVLRTPPSAPERTGGPDLDWSDNGDEQKDNDGNPVQFAESICRPRVGRQRAPRVAAPEVAQSGSRGRVSGSAGDRP